LAELWLNFLLLESDGPENPDPQDLDHQDFDPKNPDPKIPDPKIPDPKNSENPGPRCPDSYLNPEILETEVPDMNTPTEVKEPDSPPYLNIPLEELGLKSSDVSQSRFPDEPKSLDLKISPESLQLEGLQSSILHDSNPNPNPNFNPNPEGIERTLLLEGPGMIGSEIEPLAPDFNPNSNRNSNPDSNPDSNPNPNISQANTNPNFDSNLSEDFKNDPHITNYSYD
jgi:hypothetical protein